MYSAENMIVGRDSNNEDNDNNIIIIIMVIIIIICVKVNVFKKSNLSCIWSP